MAISEPGVRAAILAAVRAGLSPRRAAELVGLAGETVAHMIRQAEGREDAPPPKEIFVFIADLRKAQAENQRELLETVRKAASTPQGWVAAITLLERLFPLDFGRGPSRIEKEAQDAGEDPLAQALEDMRKAGKGPAA